MRSFWLSAMRWAWRWLIAGRLVAFRLPDVPRQPQHMEAHCWNGLPRELVAACAGPFLGYSPRPRKRQYGDVGPEIF